MSIYTYRFSLSLSEVLGINHINIPELSDQIINQSTIESGELKGYKMPPEFGMAISEACKGRPAHNKGQPNPKQRERFLKHNPMKNAESVAKMINSKKGKPMKKTTCPHCNKTGGVSRMTQYHFDNCKLYGSRNENN